MIRIFATDEYINTSLVEQFRLYCDAALRKSNRPPVNITYMKNRVYFAGISYKLFEKLILGFSKNNPNYNIEYSCGPDESNIIKALYI